MKKSKLTKLIKETKRVYVATDESGRQWIGDGRALYLAEETIKYSEYNICAILDLEADKKHEYIASEVPPVTGLTLEPTPNEEKLYPLFSVDIAGSLMTLMYTESGTVAAVAQKKIAVIDDQGPLEFAIRYLNSKPMVACYSGMLCIGIIGFESGNVGGIIYRWMNHILEQPNGYIFKAEDEEE